MSERITIQPAITPVPTRLLIAAGFRPGDDATAEVVDDGVLIRPLRAEEWLAVSLDAPTTNATAWLPPVVAGQLRAA
jgi:antitoxin component of MazEF toxin-antitoxin module